MDPPDPESELLIQGMTRSGQMFRPSDWAERLCSVMAPFRPDATVIMPRHLGYSPYVRPHLAGDVKAVVVDARLYDIDRRAYEFIIGFATDNELVTTPFCSLPRQAKR